MKIRILIFTLLIFSSIIPSVFAEPTVEIILDKPTYNYGERLFFTIKVSEVTGEQAIMHIVDEKGTGSSAIPIPISELETPVPSRYPFEKQVFSEGKYSIEISYSGVSTKEEFSLVDAGNIVIPFWIKQVAYHWITPGGVSDQTFADAIKNLVEEGIITTSQNNDQTDSKTVQIPSWIKIITLWMLEERISDEDYAQAIQYLINSKIIII